MSIEIIKTRQLPTRFYTGTFLNCETEVRATFEDHCAEWSPSKKGRSVIEVKCPLAGCGNNIKCKKEKQNE